MKKISLILSGGLALLSCNNNEASQKKQRNNIYQNVSTHLQKTDTSDISKKDSPSNRKQFILQEVQNDELFIASGIEPGWILRLFENRFLFVGNYGKDTVQNHLNNVNINKLPIEYKDKNITFKIEKQLCIAASGEEVNYSVKVIFQKRVLKGCGKVLKW